MPIQTLKACLLACLTLGTVSCVSTREVHTLGEQSATPVTAASHDRPSHLVCWNVHKASDQRFTGDVKRILGNIPREDGVILCLQEVRSTTYDLIKDLSPEQVTGHYAPSWRLPFSRRSTGVLTIGNRPLPANGVVHLRSPRREAYIASPKVSLRTQTPIANGRTLQIVNCHGLNFVPISEFPKQLDNIFASLDDPDSPAIVCGDFNVWSQRRLDILDRLARHAGLTEAKTRGPEESPAPRWLRGLNKLNGFDPEIRLDRIYTRGIEVLDCYSLPESRSSDHLPLVLKYKIAPAS